ncbi:Gfo/Idh/MocA family oxidoreductase [Streptomyces sp. NBC_01356]|uniref:Gfo/Idh/MocA family protein n=1 Tax=Streptomyces sp. NBC_01356 TaxID=2903836 RepID=UPI002E37A7A7|nr:Gfo/Idh/MocA family oxidoreductase [Streptomyces sp. NBC_01356]
MNSTPPRNDVMRWGVVGTGYIANTVLPDMIATEGLAVTAVCSRDAGRAAAFAQKWSIPRAFDDPEALFADPDIDVVYVGTPVSTHFPLARAALLAGKSVLVEKPFTLDAQEARELVALARSRNAFLMEATWTRFNAVVKAATEHVANGVIGDVRTVTTNFGRNLDSAHNAWRAELGGGALLDLGIYNVALTHHFLGGAPIRISASGTSADGFDTSCAATMEYSKGRFAQLSCSMTSWLPQHAVIGGTAGAITLPGFVNPWTYELAIGDDRETVTIQPEGAGYTPMFRAVTRAVSGGHTETAENPLEDTVAVMESIDAIRRQVLAGCAD